MKSRQWCNVIVKNDSRIRVDYSAFCASSNLSSTEWAVLGLVSYGNGGGWRKQWSDELLLSAFVGVFGAVDMTVLLLTVGDGDSGVGVIAIRTVGDGAVGFFVWF